jgi:hypothetical protein
MTRSLRRAVLLALGLTAAATASAADAELLFIAPANHTRPSWACRTARCSAAC